MLFIIKGDGNIGIKRPVIWWIAFFIFGIYSYQYDYIRVLSLIIFIGILVFGIYFKFISLKEYIKIESVKLIKNLVIVLSISFFLGNFLCYYHSNKSDEKYINDGFKSDNYYLTGVVSKIEEKEKTYELFIDKCNIIKKDIFDKEVITCKKVYVLINKSCDTLDNTISRLKLGNKINIYGTVLNFSRPSNLGQFDEYKYYKEELGFNYKMYANSIRIEKDNITLKYKIKGMLNKISNSIYEKISLVYSKDEHKIEVISAMLLGKKNKVDKAIKLKYNSAGISHILAISGLHIAIIGMTVYRVLLKLKINMYVSSIITVIIIVFYGYLTQFSVSTNRAITMMCFMLLSKFFFRTYDVLNSCFISLMIILIKNPLMINNCGLQLSYLSIIGVVVIYPEILNCFDKRITYIKNSSKEYMEKNTGNIKDYRLVIGLVDIIDKILYWFLKGIIGGISIYIITFPVIINNFYEVKIFSVIINIFVIPLMGILLILIIFSVVFAYICPICAEFCSYSVCFILDFYEKIGDLCGKIIFNNIIIGYKKGMFVIVYYFIISVTILIIKKINDKNNMQLKKIMILMMGGICLIILLIASNIKIKDDLDITMLDVGQGDSTCIITKKGKVILVDCGSSDIEEVFEDRVESFLKYKGISTIDYIAISHMDEDHLQGVIQLLEKDINKIKVKNILITPISKYNDSYNRLRFLIRKNNVNLVEIKAGDKFIIDDVRFKCIHPNSNYLLKEKSKVEINYNGASMVLCMSYKKFDILFTGDIEMDAEEKIMDEIKRMNVKIDVIKVPHHGSKYSSSEKLVSFLKPRYALFSAGKNNIYGHPHKETQDRYLKVGAYIYNTAKNGAINIITDGTSILVNNKYKME